MKGVFFIPPLVIQLNCVSLGVSEHESPGLPVKPQQRGRYQAIRAAWRGSALEKFGSVKEHTPGFRGRGASTLFYRVNSPRRTEFFFTAGKLRFLTLGSVHT